MKIIVLDASVILNFLLEEKTPLKKKFSEILKQTEAGKAKLYSPYLLSLEVGNGLRFSFSDEALAGKVLQKFLALPIDFFVFSKAHYLKILQLSYLLDSSFYDTSYHFLAKLLKGVFLTCDEKYYKKAEKLGNIKLL